mmetsp:Transcript_28798/g.81119  ORF Transcript_28798/g.81119 Transcript_28798/m.81119 type:complete len:290 (-) Transcript_28798:300-1169(-)
MAEVKVATVEQVDDAARGAHHHVHTAAQGADLLLDGDAAVEAGRVEGRGHALKLAFHLAGQLPGWGQHQAQRRAPAWLAFYLEDLLDNGQGKGEGLPRARAGAADEVTALHGGLEHGGLDGEEGLNALALHGINSVPREIKVRVGDQQGGVIGNVEAAINLDEVVLLTQGVGKRPALLGADIKGGVLILVKLLAVIILIVHDFAGGEGPRGGEGPVEAAGGGAVPESEVSERRAEEPRAGREQAGAGDAGGRADPGRGAVRGRRGDHGTRGGEAGGDHCAATGGGCLRG